MVVPRCLRGYCMVSVNLFLDGVPRLDHGKVCKVGSTISEVEVGLKRRVWASCMLGIFSSSRPRVSLPPGSHL